MTTKQIPFSVDLKSHERQWCECTVDYDETGIHGKATDMTYLGQGKYQCPKCGYIEDMSNDTYKVRLQFKKRLSKLFGPCLDVSILKPIFDERLNKKWEKDCVGTIKDALVEDLEGEFKHHEEGIFDCEIVYNYYRCSYEYEEYDYNLRILAEAKINLPVVNKKVKE